ncbi:hypothetical protein [Novosphingobium barchaimii]|nr:hypothetical protein [Novosphingobium barchaimii]
MAATHPEIANLRPSGHARIAAVFFLATRILNANKVQTLPMAFQT